MDTVTVTDVAMQMRASEIRELINKTRMAAFEEAARLAEASDASYDNGTGHYRGGWRDARRDIAESIRACMRGDQSV